MECSFSLYIFFYMWFFISFYYQLFTVCVIWLKCGNNVDQSIRNLNVISLQQWREGVSTNRPLYTDVLINSCQVLSCNLSVECHFPLPEWNLGPCYDNTNIWMQTVTICFIHVWEFLSTRPARILDRSGINCWKSGRMKFCCIEILFFPYSIWLLWQEFHCWSSKAVNRYCTVRPYLSYMLAANTMGR